MAQQNHNINYIVDVDGITIWEKARVIRNFLKDRELALKLAEHSLEKIDNNNFKEYISKKQLEDNIENAKDEIKFLKEYEKKLAIEAEKTRIPNKTDNEMYEINFYEESIQQCILTVQSEVLSLGQVTPNTMKNLIKNTPAMTRVISLGLVNPEIVKVLQNNNQECLSLKVDNNMIPKEVTENETNHKNLIINK